MRLKNNPFTMQMLGYDVAWHQGRREKKKSVMDLPKMKCIKFVFDALQGGFVRCGVMVDSNQNHGWLCKGHANEADKGLNLLAQGRKLINLNGVTLVRPLELEAQEVIDHEIRMINATPANRKVRLFV